MYEIRSFIVITVGCAGGCGTTGHSGFHLSETSCKSDLVERGWTFITLDGRRRAYCQYCLNFITEESHEKTVPMA